ncbi:MAG: 5-formyltetrahydrofolate cyclo-ligase, partial [Treponema sp.]|nr:5-formyltetrahydrofolate cyclo-ligase [Treponema sp.]
MTVSKEELRARARKRLEALSGDVFDKKGAEAAARLWAWDGWSAYRSALVFLSTAFEINTQPLLDLARIDGKRVFAPRVERSSLGFFRIGAPRAAAGGRASGKDRGGSPGPWAEGAFGIREPPPEFPLASEDFPALVIVPGLAFDRRGGRLGRGRGFYDRFLAGLDSGTLPGLPSGLSFTVCGLCLELQIAAAVPVEDHDRKMDMVLTESGF